MKRTILFLLLILCTVALATAQSPGPGRRPGVPAPAQPARPGSGGQIIPGLSAEKITVTGELTIVRGSIGVKSGDDAYMTIGLNRYVGFIDSLRDGARVTVEGRTMNHPFDANTKIILISKLTVGGKDYDMESPRMTMPGRSAEKQPQPPQNPRDRPQPERQRQPVPQRQWPNRRPFN